jgi:hypothetical protein
MTRAAIMLFLWASLPLLLVVPSLSIRTGCPEPVVVKYAIPLTSCFGCRTCLIGFMQKSNENINFKARLCAIEALVMFVPFAANIDSEFSAFLCSCPPCRHKKRTNLDNCFPFPAVISSRDQTLLMQSKRRIPGLRYRHGNIQTAIQTTKRFNDTRNPISVKGVSDNAYFSSVLHRST